MEKRKRANYSKLTKLTKEAKKLGQVFYHANKWTVLIPIQIYNENQKTIQKLRLAGWTVKHTNP